ncbi:MAG: VWA domain-containing protein [Candidatus Obscuribacterales bacterium]|nr:VWA domain-containing protein [Candidatus Obscuribacterales bacterium]
MIRNIKQTLARRRNETLRLASILWIPGLIAGSYSPVCAAEKPAKSRTMLTGEVNQLLVLCSAAGLTLDKPSVPAAITKLRLGSTAAYSGLRAGDQILDAKVDQNILQLTLQRGDKRFQARMAVDSKALKAMIPKSEPVKLTVQSVAKNVSLSSNHLASNITEAQAEEILSEYRFIILIDRSGSMGESESGGQAEFLNPDAIPSNKLGWVKSNISTFADFLRTRSSFPVTLIPFNASHTLEVVNSPVELRSTVENLRPEGGTNLTSALSRGVAIALQENRKQMVVVLTDGMNNIGNLEQTMINATEIVPPGQVVVSFIQIGNDSSGINTVADLDTGLIAKGAKYDMVDAKYFSDVKRYGLKRVLADAIIRAMAPRKK